MAAARDRRPTSPARGPASTAPPYYIAVEPLFVGGQFGRAHNVGDLVPVEHVAQYGWADKVRPPDGYTAAPDQPPSEPDTAPSGQATSTEGEA